MRTIKTYRKVGAFYIACEEDFPASILIYSPRSTVIAALRSGS